MESFKLSSMEKFYRHVFELVESIQDCLDKQRILPCLMLLYVGIDVIASLDTGGRASRKGFIKWVATYLLKDAALECNAIDLYAARCGVVHTLTAQSDLSRSGKARVIAYAWGNADAQMLRSATALMKRNDVVHVHVTELVVAFRNGIATYLDDIGSDSMRQQVFEKAVGEWYTHLAAEPFSQLLALHDQARDYADSSSD
jgi:hypothetical protein